jgi:hypothetical protein
LLARPPVDREPPFLYKLNGGSCGHDLSAEKRASTVPVAALKLPSLSGTEGGARGGV